MMEFTYSVEGIGICLEDTKKGGPERVVDLIRQAPELYESFSTYCSSNGIHCVSMPDFTGWIGCQQVNYAIAVILSRVIAEREKVLFEPASVRVIHTGEISTFLVFEKEEPWKYSDREKALTFKECQELLESYVSFISDDIPFVGLMDFGEEGRRSFPGPEKV